LQTKHGETQIILPTVLLEDLRKVVVSAVAVVILEVDLLAKILHFQTMQTKQ